MTDKIQLKRYKEFRAKLKQAKKEDLILPETYRNAKDALRVLKDAGISPDRVHAMYDKDSRVAYIALAFAIPFPRGFCVMAKKDCIYSVSYELDPGTLARKSYNVSVLWLAEAMRVHESTQQISVKKK
jgi:hypothetical protein